MFAAPRSQDAGKGLDEYRLGALSGGSHCGSPLQVKGLDVIPGLRKDLESFRAQNAALQASSAKLQVLL